MWMGADRSRRVTQQPERLDCLGLGLGVGLGLRLGLGLGMGLGQD